MNTMSAIHNRSIVRRLIALSVVASAATAFGGTEPAPVMTTAPQESGHWNWFAGGSIGYLLDYETEIYHIHLGTEYHSPSGYSHGFFLEVGYAEGLESQFAGSVSGDFDPQLPGLEPGTAAFDGEIEVIPVTLNYKLEGCLADNFKWYVGAGLGAASVDAGCRRPNSFNARRRALRCHVQRSPQGR